MALNMIGQVLWKKQPLDAVLDQFFRKQDQMESAGLPSRDRAFIRALTAVTLRRKGQIDALFQSHLDHPLKGRTNKFVAIARLAVAQLLFFDTPLHAVSNLALFQCRQDPKMRHLDKVLAAILRRISDAGTTALETQDAARLNTPHWLFERWERHFGAETATKIALAHLHEAPLDISVKQDAEGWAEKFGGRVLPTGTVRLSHKGRITELPGFEEGSWWVQDAAAALPVRLLGDISGKRIADLGAAPGGKTAQLAALGAHVTAIDSSKTRNRRLHENLARLGLPANVVTENIFTYEPDASFDGILLDAPCTSTGTVRRHPDLPYLKSEADVVDLANLQKRMLSQAFTWLKPGGSLIYCVCSLEPEEGALQIQDFLKTTPDSEVHPLNAEALGLSAEVITPEGFLRTLPYHAPDAKHPEEGMDGFFAARIVRVATPS